MKGFAIILNILLPGVGSFMIGKAGQGIGQIIVWGLGLLLTIGTLGVGGVLGIPMMIGGWIWAIITAAGGPQQNITVHVDGQNKS